MFQDRVDFQDLFASPRFASTFPGPSLTFIGGGLLPLFRHHAEPTRKRLVCTRSMRIRNCGAGLILLNCRRRGKSFLITRRSFYNLPPKAEDDLSTPQAKKIVQRTVRSSALAYCGLPAFRIGCFPFPRFVGCRPILCRSINRGSPSITQHPPGFIPREPFFQRFAVWIRYLFARCVPHRIFRTPWNSMRGPCTFRKTRKSTTRFSRPRNPFPQTPNQMRF